MSKYGFEWDERKNEENRRKHGVSFEEAQYVFGDRNRILIEDEKHSEEEQMFFCIGKIHDMAKMEKIL